MSTEPVYLPVAAGMNELPTISLDGSMPYPNASLHYGLTSYYQQHQPIFIHGDKELVTKVDKNGWSGDGTVDDPFIISQISFNATHEDTLLTIAATRLHFVIRDSLFIGANIAILLLNVQNGVILNNTVVNNNSGIFLSESEYNQIIENTVRNNMGNGISIEFGGSNEVNNNVIENNDVGITVAFSSRNYLVNNEVAHNVGIGIQLSTTRSDHLENNTISNNAQTGINAIRGDLFSIINNQIIENGGGGIRAADTIWYAGDARAEIIGNEIISNNGTGIQINDSNEFEIRGNKIQETVGSGIFLWDTFRNIIEDNEIIGSSDFGIELINSADNMITRNDFIHNRCQSNSYAGCSQGYSNSMNEISNNYWADWTTPDTNYDCIVDHPYLLEGIQESDYAPTIYPNREDNLFCKIRESAPSLIWDYPIPSLLLLALVVFLVVRIVRKRVQRGKKEREMTLLYPVE
jgi:parallel beta-helix repeat protein